MGYIYAGRKIDLKQRITKLSSIVIKKIPEGMEIHLSSFVMMHSYHSKKFYSKEK